MTIKAVLRDGRIQPLEPLPSDWKDGQELVVEQPESSSGGAEVSRWATDLDIETTRVSAKEHDRFRQALDAIER